MSWRPKIGQRSQSNDLTVPLQKELSALDHRSEVPLPRKKLRFLFASLGTAPFHALSFVAFGIELSWRFHSSLSHPVGRKLSQTWLMQILSEL